MAPPDGPCSVLLVDGKVRRCRTISGPSPRRGTQGHGRPDGAGVLQLLDLVVDGAGGEGRVGQLLDLVAVELGAGSRTATPRVPNRYPPATPRVPNRYRRQGAAR